MLFLQQLIVHTGTLQKKKDKAHNGKKGLTTMFYDAIVELSL